MASQKKLHNLFGWVGLVALIGLFSFENIAEARGNRAEIYRAPMGGYGSARNPVYQFRLPKYVTEVRPELKLERLNRLNNHMFEMKLTDRSMLDYLRSKEAEHLNGKEFANKFEKLTREIDAALKAKNYDKAVELLKQREEGFFNFAEGAGKAGGRTRVSIRPGSETGKQPGEWSGVLDFTSKVSTVTPSRVSGETIVAHANPNLVSTTGSRPRGRSGSRNRRPTAPERTQIAIDTKLKGEVLGEQGLAGMGAIGKTMATTVEKAVEALEGKGAGQAANKFLAKLKDVVDTLNSMGPKDVNRREMMKVVLREILASKGITAESLEELAALSDPKIGPKALQGMHRMAVVLRELRENYEREVKDPEPKAGTEEHRNWLVRRDKYIGEKMVEWIEYGEVFRKSIEGAKNKGEFLAWMRGESKHDKLAENDPRKRPDKMLAKSFCDGDCAKHMHLQFTNFIRSGGTCRLAA